MILSDTLRGVLDCEPWPLLLLDRQARIHFTNPAWDAAAERDGAPECLGRHVHGRSWLDAITGPQRDFYARMLKRAFAQLPGARQLVLEHVSECNTPMRVRTLTTRFVPLASKQGDVEALLVCSWLRDSGPLTGLGDGVRSFVDANGLMVQCGCCRRMRAPGTDVWHRVPMLMTRTSAKLSHSLCGLCLELYYGDLGVVTL